MISPDLGNALFEFFGGCLIWLSVRQLYRDKKVRGVHIAPIAFFAAWGVWNLYFYPAIGQWYSFLAGINVVIANLVWIGQMWYYRRR